MEPNKTLEWLENINGVRTMHEVQQAAFMMQPTPNLAIFMKDINDPSPDEHALHT